MKKIASVALGTALILGTSGLAFAGMGTTNTNPNRTTAPGQIQKNSTTGTTAQESAPGQIQKNTMGATTAREAAPGQVKKDATTGSTGGTTTTTKAR